jgi:hypothetical protein
MMMGFFKLSGEQSFLHFKEGDYPANGPFEQRRLTDRSASAICQHAINLPAKGAIVTFDKSRDNTQTKILRNHASEQITGKTFVLRSDRWGMPDA